VKLLNNRKVYLWFLFVAALTLFLYLFTGCPSFDMMFLIETVCVGAVFVRHTLAKIQKDINKPVDVSVKVDRHKHERYLR